MQKAIIFVALGLILLGVAGWVLFPNVRSDIVSAIPFIGQSSNKTVTLKYWGIWEPREVMQPLIDAYQAEHPNVIIEYDERPPEDYYEGITSRISSEGAPDIVRVHASWIPYLKESLSSLPSKIMSVEEYESTFYPVNQTMLKSDGKYYAIPLMIDGLSLVYNKALFEESGITGPPPTWKDFRNYAARLTKYDSSGNLTQAGAAIGYAQNVDYAPDLVALMFAQNGVQFQDAAGKVTFGASYSQDNRNLAAEALDFYALFAKDEQAWDPDWDNSTKEFAQGKVGMVFLPSHRLHEIHNLNPGLNYGVASVPQLTSIKSADEGIGWATYWVETVLDISPNKTEAWEFLAWLSEKDQLVEMYRNASNIRAFGEPYPRMDMASILNTEAKLVPYVQQAQTYKTWYIADSTYNTTISDQIAESIRSMAQSAANGASTPAAADTSMAEVQAILNRVLK